MNEWKRYLGKRTYFLALKSLQKSKSYFMQIKTTYLTWLWKKKKKTFICSKSSNPLDLSQKNPRAKCQYFTETLAAS
jgi:hypothetical protein